EFELSVVASGGRITLGAGTHVFGRDVLRRLAARYRRVLEAMAADPQGDAGDPCLPEEELTRLLVDWNTTVEQPVHHRVPDVFAAHVAATPHAAAVTCGDQHLTYAELDERANRLAHHLIGLGAGPGTLVGVSLERDIDLVPTLLGVLKSGAAYLPLDPTNPVDRLAYVLDDAGAPLLITRTRHVATFAGIHDGPVVLLDGDTDRAALAARPATAPAVAGTPDDLMYVIYTSGSTGRPKGVGLSHANVLRMFTAIAEQMRFSSDDVCTQSHSYAFDFSVWEMWGALLHGGRVVIVPTEVGRSPEEFLDLLVEQRVTVVCRIPSAFRPLAALAADGDERVDRLALRAVVFGGERLDPAELRPWVDRLGLDEPMLVNLYGPTEITVHCTFHRVDADDFRHPARSVLGHHLTDLRVHLLDSHGRLVPVGVPGELYVGGPGLARGYLGRPALTAERFVPDPYGPPGTRLYRTGDLGLRLPDGRLEFLGRIDSQVKVRGYRIELGEIEAALREHPGIADTVVVARADRAGEKSLAAYVVPAGQEDGASGPGGGLDSGLLREHLAATLPDYMIPAAFVTLDAVPLMANGKIDYRALPAPDRDAFDTGRYVAPRTPVEERLAAVWGEVLGLDRVSVEDGFFDLGGDSLRAVRLAGALRAAGFDVSVQDVFEHRTVAGLGTHLAGQGGGTSLVTAVAPFALTADEDRALLPADVVDAYPLSQIQTGMLAETMAAGPDGRAVYHNLNSFRIRDDRPFSLDALQKAVDTVVARHDILRTSMHLSGYSQPLQLVHATADFPVTLRDLRGLDAAEQERHKAEYVAQEHAVVFDLTTAPLMNISALLEADDAWRLNFTYHHAVSEGWSYNALMMEIVECYRRLRDGGEVPDYEAPAVRYADFIAAESASVASGEDRAFWRGVTDGHASFRLPETWGDPEGSAEERHGLQVPFADLEGPLRELARTAGTSLKSVLLAAHLKVLSALTPDEAFHAGVVYHGRLEAPGADRVLGMHLNTLPFPAVRPSSGTWREWVERVYAQETEIWSHRRYPLPAVQRDAGNARHLISVLFEYLDFHHVDTDKVDTAQGLNDGINEFAMNVIPTKGNFNLGSTTEVISRENLRRLGSMYRRVLEAMAGDPDGDARAVCLPDGEPEAAADVTAWDDSSALELFASQVTARADEVAVVCGEQAVTYGELEERSSRLAHHLRGAGGVVRGGVVGLSLSRTPDVLVSMLAVWKVGAAYLPIDPALPGERAAYMAEDAGAVLVVTDDYLAGVDLDGLPAVFETGSVDAEQAAYVLYTSGSTGRPKGVVISHRALHNLLASLRERLGSGPGDVWLASTSISFDISGLELHLPLITGGRVVLAGDSEAKDATALIALTAAHGVTHMQATPSGWRLLLAAGFADRSVVALTGGEPINAEMAGELGLHVSRLVNVYGPTETTIWSSFWDVPTALDGGVSIGDPLANTQLYVLDSKGGPVPDGVTGELCIAGDGLAHGYHARPALTAEKFAPNPYGPAGSRLYRTGDLARRLSDGTFECLGRIDSQVKVRGYRIELGEIEAVLRQVPGVENAVVVAREDQAGDKTLVAYVVGEPDLASLREHLLRGLPEYMVPAAYVTVEAIPLTNSGKVDHRALPAPDQTAYAGGRRTAPRTPSEERLAAIWATVLEQDEVGVEDSFFDLGGDSIRAVRLVGALRAAGYDVDVRAVFEHRTIAALATHLTGAAQASLLNAVEPFELLGEADRAALPADVVDAYPLSQIQTGMLVEMLAAQEQGRSAYQNINSFRIPDDQPFSPNEFRAAVDHITQRHDTLRTTLHLTGYSRPLQLVHGTAAVPVTVHDLRGVSTSEQHAALRAFAAEEQATGFELAGGPALRVAVHVESDEAWRITFTYVHAIADGWSYHTLLMEIVECYRRLRDGEEAPGYEAPAVRYADFVAAELASLDGDEDRAFWQDVVERHAPVSLPESWADARASAPDTYEESIPFADLADGLLALARQANASLKTVLLAAHLKALSALTAEDDFHTGVVFHGRLEAPGSDRVLGMHLNTLPFPATRPSAGTWRELVERVHAQETDIWAHRRYPLPAIQRDTGDARRLVSVLFEYLDFHQVDTSAVDIAAGLNDGANEFALNVAASPRHIALIASGETISGANLRRLAALYRQVLEAMAADPAGTAGEAHLPAEELAAALAAPPATEWSSVSALELFAGQVRARAGEVAVVSGEQRLTYGELEERSNRLAHHLRGAGGVVPGGVVGLALHRTPDVLVSMLAVWKVGAAYLPIDPALPGERAAYMAEDAGATLVVTDDYLAGVDLDRLPAVFDTSLVDPEQAAYVLYTSGSTGRPKGVVISHRALHNLLASLRDQLAADHAGVWLASTSISFDISGLELHLPLISGGRVVLAGDTEAKDATALMALTAAHGVTHVQATPSGWRLLLAAGFDDRAVTGLVGGESLNGELARELGSRVGRLVNVYGPTETTIWSSAWDIPNSVDGVSIGGPLANTQLYVLDAQGRPVPVGITGELCIAGDGLAHGYHQRPELTAEKFLPNPYGPAGSRLYRTGDLARRLPDGTFECLGRIDSQVKVRGYRIELGEIEARLREHPDVTDAVVTVREDQAGDKTLVAYLVGAAAPADLRGHLGGTLPEYMVPAAYLTLDAIPLTNSGKVDHRALPAPDRTTYAGGGPRTAPRTPVEKRLAAIWCELLGVDDVGVEDGFFDLGGDSLRAVRMLAECREAGLPVAMWMILQARSLGDLAALMAAAEADDARFPEDGMPLLPGHVKWLDGYAAGTRTVRVPWDGRADAAVLRQALAAVVRHHQALRLVLDTVTDTVTDTDTDTDASPAVARLAETEIADGALLRVADLADVPAERRAEAVRAAVAESAAEIDARTGAALRATLVRFDDAPDDELWLSGHELALDESSWAVVLTDLATAVRQLDRGRAVQLPEVPVPLHGWARQLAERARSEDLLDQAEAWLGTPDAAPLPVDHEVDNEADHKADDVTRDADNTVTVSLAPAETAALLADERPERILLSTLGRVLARWAGADRIGVEVTVDPRREASDEAAALARTVGPLTDGVPVSLRLPRDRGPAADLTSVTRQLKALPAPRYGHGLLRWLAPDPDVAEELAALPAPQVRFGFTPAPEVGDAEQPFVPAHAVVQDTELPDGLLLDVDARVHGDRLYLRWTHRTAVHEESTVRKLAEEQAAELGTLLRDGARRPRRSAAPATAGVRDAVEEVMARHRIPGASLALVRDGEVAEVRAFGVQGTGQAVPVTGDTLFAAGSISKHLTAFTVLRLASEGLLDLDRDVNEYLTSWRVPDGRPVTARLLLGNQAGFAEHPDLTEGYRRHDPVPTVLDVLNGRAPARTPAAHRQDAPGAVFRLTPVHYSVLQQTMTDLTGEAYPDLVRRLVFDPLGMTGSGFEPRLPDLSGREFAHGHDTSGAPVPDGYYVNPEAAAGGLWSTAADLAALAVQVRRCRLGLPGALVEQDLVREMLTPRSGRMYGWSTIVDDSSGDLEFGHGGQAYGYQAMTGLRLHSGVGAVLLTNAVAGRELVRHVIATTWTERTRTAGLWQRAIDEAVRREQGGDDAGAYGV
ncbi:amino acid adenylation domain-containing protein, partial [Streptomyces shaanxiensis]